MMYLPSIFGEDLMDRWMDEMDRNFFGRKDPLAGHHARNLMKTDVREKEDAFELDVDLPGYTKDQVQLELENGCLTITASKGLDKEEKDEKTGKVIRQERYAGSMSRSFYVGEDVTENDIRAKMENGVLSLKIPKIEKKPELPKKKVIAIEG